MNRPQNRTIEKVVTYLESIGLEVIGPGVDLDDGEEFAGNMCFNFEDIKKYIKLHDADAFWRATKG